MRIYKYELMRKNEFTVNLPRGFKFLDVQVQRGKPYMWCLVDENESAYPTTFYIHSTGRSVDTAHKEFLGTFQMHDGDFVFHLFQKSQ